MKIIIIIIICMDFNPKIIMIMKMILKKMNYRNSKSNYFIDKLRQAKVQTEILK